MLLQPLRGPRWASISRYADEIATHAALTGAQVTVAEAPWFNPTSLARGASSRWWRQRAVVDAESGVFGLVHLTDQALGHHVARFHKAATVVTCHDVMPWFLPGYFAGAAEGFVKRSFLRPSVRGMLRARHLVCVSATTAADVARLYDYDPSRITVVPNTVDDLFVPGERTVGDDSAPFDVLPGGPRILSVGHSGPYKNLELLIEALAEDCLAGACVVRAGASLTRGQRTLASRRGVAERIIEVGRVSDPILAHLYNACDVLAQPSRYEGFGIPVVEAMACGLPVVSSDGGALPEVAAGAARIVPLARGAPGDARAFAGALAEVIDDAHLRASLRAAGLDRAQHFRPAEVMPQLGRVYASLAAGGIPE